MEETFSPGQIYESENGIRIVIIKVDSDRVSFVAYNGAFTRNDVLVEEVRTMFPKYCGISTFSYT